MAGPDEGREPGSLLLLAQGGTAIGRCRNTLRTATKEVLQGYHDSLRIGGIHQIAACRVSLFEKYELGLKPKTVYELVPEFFRSFES
jgi:hypothetical protein